VSKIIGLDIGQHSVGWAVVDSKAPENRLLKSGTFMFPGKIERLSKVLPVKQKKPVAGQLFMKAFILLPLVFSLGAMVLAVFLDWQYWLNIAVAFLIAFFSLVKK